jgi:hypothetical protein
VAKGNNREAMVMAAVWIWGRRPSEAMKARVAEEMAGAMMVPVLAPVMAAKVPVMPVEIAARRNNGDKNKTNGKQ